MSLDLLAAMRVFTTVVEAGSFAAAADRLEISRAMVTRHVAQLESHLNVRLMHRTTRRLSLTEAGTEYHRRAAQVLALAQEAGDAATRHARAPSGRLRVTCSAGLGERHLQQAITGFLREQPGVQLDLSLSEHMVDLVEEGFDLAVRVGTAMEPGLVARRLARVRTLLCASPAYLRERGAPRTPHELAGHNCMSYAHKDWRSAWAFARSGHAQQEVPIAGNFRANGGGALVGAAVAGLGIVLEPEFLVCEALAAGRLVRVLPAWQTPEMAAYAVFPERHHLPLKVRCFVDWLVDAWRDAPWEAWEHAQGR